MKKDIPDDVTLSYHFGRFFACVGLGVALIIIVSAGLAQSFQWTQKLSHQYAVSCAIALLMFVVGWCLILRKR